VDREFQKGICGIKTFYDSTIENFAREYLFFYLPDYFFIFGKDGRDFGAFLEEAGFRPIPFL
jgi:hypothetical protein